VSEPRDAYGGTNEDARALVRWRRYATTVNDGSVDVRRHPVRLASDRTRRLDGGNPRVPRV